MGGTYLTTGAIVQRKEGRGHHITDGQMLQLKPLSTSLQIAVQVNPEHWTHQAHVTHTPATSLAQSFAHVAAV